MQTVITCYNCHFNSVVEGHIKRAVKILQNYILLGTRASDNKIYPATFMALYYKTPSNQDTSFYTVVPYYSHSIVSQGRECNDCHNNQNVQDYNNTGELVITQWDANQHMLMNRTGVIPLVPDWQTAFKFDFLNYTGQLDTSYTDPTLWELAESGTADHTQNLGYILPLTQEQMNWLSTPMAIDESEDRIPKEFALYQNYPNPFNPTTTISFSLPISSRVTLKIYDLTGQEVATLLENQQLTPGTHEINFEAEQLPSGVYLYRLWTTQYSAAKKMVLIK
ncbi:MAG: T9SS C-terminal target domain-containing protein [Calditrichaeota bacterium]|nr:MAG: T9SS C-terminal target domain-containing protein [Calditrichota bacterium]